MRLFFCILNKWSTLPTAPETAKRPGFCSAPSHSCSPSLAWFCFSQRTVQLDMDGGWRLFINVCVLQWNNRLNYWILGLKLLLLFNSIGFFICKVKGNLQYMELDISSSRSTHLRLIWESELCSAFQLGLLLVIFTSNSNFGRKPLLGTN